jgi:L-ascorbate metabolism protein UlaG (beta-lactamase superfamily)
MGIKIKWFPPSWLQIIINDKIIYIDPAYLKTYYAKHPKKIEYSSWPNEIDGLPEELEQGDLILVTHSHKDHCKNVTIKRLMKKTSKIFAPNKCQKEIKSDITAVTPKMKYEFEEIHIETIDAYNTASGNSTKKQHKKGKGVGYVIVADGKKIYHAGDTDLIPEMKTLNNIDVAFLPIGGTFTMDIEEAVQAALTIKPKIVIPMHYMKSDVSEFKNLMSKHKDIKTQILNIGEGIAI